MQKYTRNNVYIHTLLFARLNNLYKKKPKTKKILYKCKFATCVLLNAAKTY